MPYVLAQKTKNRIQWGSELSLIISDIFIQWWISLQNLSEINQNHFVLQHLWKCPQVLDVWCHGVNLVGSVWGFAYPELVPKSGFCALRVAWCRLIFVHVRFFWSWIWNIAYVLYNERASAGIKWTVLCAALFPSKLCMPELVYLWIKMGLDVIVVL